MAADRRALFAVAFSPDGQWVAVGGDSEVVSGHETAALGRRVELAAMLGYEKQQARALALLADDMGLVPVTLVSTSDEWTRQWARLEERIVKPLTRLASPWLEVYARRE